MYYSVANLHSVLKAFDWTTMDTMYQKSHSLCHSTCDYPLRRVLVFRLHATADCTRHYLVVVADGICVHNKRCHAE